MTRLSIAGIPFSRHRLLIGHGPLVPWGGRHGRHNLHKRRTRKRMRAERSWRRGRISWQEFYRRCEMADLQHILPVGSYAPRAWHYGVDGSSDPRATRKFRRRLAQ